MWLPEGSQARHCRFFGVMCSRLFTTYFGFLNSSNVCKMRDPCMFTFPSVGFWKKIYKENSFRTQNKPQNTIWNIPDIYIKRDASCSNNYFIVRSYSLIFHHEYSVLKFTLHELSPDTYSWPILLIKLTNQWICSGWLSQIKINI